MTESAQEPEVLLPPTEEQKPSVGRPLKITAEMAEKIFFLAAKGCNDAEIAKILDMNVVTIFRAKKDVEFSKVLSAAKEEADLAVINSLYHRALGYSHPEEKIFCNEGQVTRVETVKHYPPDTAAGVFWLTNRQRQAWRREIQHEDPKANKPPMIRLFSKVDGKEAARIKQAGESVNVLLGDDFVAEVKKDTDGTGPENRI